MSDAQGRPWSNNSNAPKISYDLYFYEKDTFAGFLIGSVLYGIVIILFFRCMTVLFDPVRHRTEGIKWGLVTHTITMFSVVTVGTTMQLYLQSACYVDNREFPGFKGLPGGPLGYRWSIYSGALGIVPNLMFFLNNWLADALLLYRCFIIYSRNLWIIAFPCLVYLGSLVMGITFLYQSTDPTSTLWSSLPYFTISLSLNILLTLMIVIRLILHTKNLRAAMGTTGSDGLYKAIVTMLIESCALYAVISSLVIGPWVTGNHVADTFLSILTQTQVIAPLLIIQRVADKSALTSDTVVSRHISFEARSRGEFTSESGTLPGGCRMGLAVRHEKNSGELGVGVETTIDSHRDMI